jgi:hypothetical protein
VELLAHQPVLLPVLLLAFPTAVADQLAPDADLQFVLRRFAAAVAKLSIPLFLGHAQPIHAAVNSGLD